jgi:hypothetical protein
VAMAIDEPGAEQPFENLNAITSFFFINNINNYSIGICNQNMLLQYLIPGKNIIC